MSGLDVFPIVPKSRYPTIAARLTAAVVVGYALAVSVSACLSLVLPMARADGVLTGLLASFIVYAAAVIWAFSVKSVGRMCWGLVGTTTFFAALAALTMLLRDGATA